MSRLDQTSIHIAAESADHSGSPHDDPNVGFRDPKSTPLHYRRYKPAYQRNYKKGISLQKRLESDHSLGLFVLYNFINFTAGKYNPAKKILQQGQL